MQKFLSFHQRADELTLFFVLLPASPRFVCALIIISYFSELDSTTKVTITAIKTKNPIGKNTPNIISTSGPKTNM
jgi:hypothetical protein